MNLRELQAKEREIKKFERDVSSMTSEQKWRYVVRVMLERNPEARFEHAEVLKYIDATRREQAKTTASNMSGSMRFGLRMPTTVLEAIQLADPHVAVIMAGRNIKEQNALVRKLMKVFPEYKIPHSV